MKPETKGALVALGVSVVLLIVQMNWFIASQTYTESCARQWLYRARATNDLQDMATYLGNAEVMLKDYHGNPAWLYPRPDTDWDLIRQNINETAMNARKWSLANITDMAYQQAVHNLQETISQIADHINAADTAMWFSPVINRTGYVAWAGVGGGWIAGLFIGIWVEDLMDAVRHRRYAAKHQRRERMLELAQNKDVPPEVLRKIAKDVDPDEESDLAFLLLRHPKAPEGVIIKMLSKQSYSRFGTYAKPGSGTWAGRVAFVSRLSPKALERMVELGLDDDVVLTSPKCPKKLWDRCISDIEGDLWKLGENKLAAIAGNPKAPPELLAKFVKKHWAWEVRAAASENPNTPVEALGYRLLNDAKREEAPVLMTLALNPKSPPKLLEELAKSQLPEVLFAVARHPSTPIQLLELLAKNEPYSQVRKGAQEVLASRKAKT